jgi:hypothetical protein
LRRGEIDWDLSDLVDRQGGFATTLTYRDRLRLRSIVRRVHLSHYPRDLVDDRMADRLIEIIAPATAAYLIRLNLDKGKL